MIDFPLSGITVLEGALQYPGPYCGMLLSQLGAEVIKIEMPGTGDPARGIPSFFNAINANKKSITINLKKPEGKQILLTLAKGCDVFMEGFRPGVVGRLGIDYNSLTKENPGIIYCSISGYGQSGPYCNLPGHDLNYQALSGMLHSCFRDSSGKYMPPGLAIADLSSGMFAAISILSAVIQRKSTRKGQYIDISMLDALFSLLSTHLGVLQETGQSDRVKDAGYGLFKTADDQFIALGIAHEDWFWDRLCTTPGLQDLRGINGRERRLKRQQLVDRLQEFFSTKTQTEILSLLADKDIPVSPVNKLEQAMNDPHVQSRRLLHEVGPVNSQNLKVTRFPAKFSQMKESVQKPPPSLGEHTEALLIQHGYRREELERFKASEII